MNHRAMLMLGVIVGSLLATLPAQAENGRSNNAFMFNSRSNADEGSRFDRTPDNRKNSRRATRRNDDGKGYGYGYERRQREPSSNDSPADERRRPDARSGGDDRSERRSRGFRQ